jgi:hypothetical protein
MGKTKVNLTLAGFYGLRTSPEMLSALKTEAAKVQARAGAGFESSVKAGAKTAVARVYPTGAAGIRAEAKHGALSKAVGGWNR